MYETRVKDECYDILFIVRGRLLLFLSQEKELMFALKFEGETVRLGGGIVYDSARQAG